ncbi:MAG: trypsin-like peptidase domain-containing protein [Anaerolineae bacterium]
MKVTQFSKHGSITRGRRVAVLLFAMALMLLVSACDAAQSLDNQGAASSSSSTTSNSAPTAVSGSSSTSSSAGQTTQNTGAPAANSAQASSSTSGQAPAANQSAPAPVSAADFSTAVRNVSDQVRPAVVQITNEQSQVNQLDQSFNVPTGVGSGVIYDNQGHILTNNHVIAGAQQLLVSLPDGRSFPAKPVGADPQTDLAVVQISGDNLPTAQLGDSRQLGVGDWVVAIGNALALEGGPTVTAGVVSALGRTIQEPGDTPTSSGPFLFDVIQTSAPINPGNSGGPLINLNGQVVGINTLVAGQSEPGVPAQGIGFAIAISTAKPIADQLVSSGHVDHPYVGIMYAPLNPAIARQLNTQQAQGVVIQQVVQGTPAAAAGLRARDVITAIDGNQIKGGTDLAEALSSHKPGDTVTLTVNRNGANQDVKVKLGTMPAS